MCSGTAAHLNVVSHAVVIESSFWSELFLTLLTFESVPQLQEKDHSLWCPPQISWNHGLYMRHFIFQLQWYKQQTMYFITNKAFVGLFFWKALKYSLPAPHDNCDNDVNLVQRHNGYWFLIIILCGDFNGTKIHT